MTDPLEAEPPSRDDGEIEEGEIQGEQSDKGKLRLTFEIGWATSHRPRRRNSESPTASQRRELVAGQSMSRRHRVTRERRDGHREREYFSRNYDVGGVYRTERSSFDAAHENDVLLKEIHALTKRVGVHDAAKSLDVLCRELKASMKKLDKIRRLGNKSRNDHPDAVECAHRVFSGLRSVHGVCSGRLAKNQNWDAVMDLMQTAMNYRHVMFGTSQKRDVESWYHELDLCLVKEGERTDDSRERSFGRTSVQKSLRPSSLEGEASVGMASCHSLDEGRSRVEEAATCLQGAHDRLLSRSRSPIATDGHHFSTSKGEKDDTFKETRHDGDAMMHHDEQLRRETPPRDRDRSGWTDTFLMECQVGESRHSARESYGRYKDNLKPEEASRRSESEPIRLAFDPAPQLLETSRARIRESEFIARESVKKQRCEAEELVRPGTVHSNDTGTKNETQTPDGSPVGRKERVLGHNAEEDTSSSGRKPCSSSEISRSEDLVAKESEKESIFSTPCTQQPTSETLVKSGETSSGCEWQNRMASGAFSHDSDKQRGSTEQGTEAKHPFRQQDRLGLRSVRYTATEANDVKDGAIVTRSSPENLLSDPADFVDLAIPPPPPPLIFKPKPISPDVTFDPQPDAFWESLLFHVPFRQGNYNREMSEILSEGKMCLVLDLDTVLFSTTKFSELDGESTKLLRLCLENESCLPFFARSLHCIHGIDMWVKLRPGLNKFLRVARNGFRLYGHTSRSKEEVELILKVIDPDGWISIDRIIYQERAPGECVFKKMNSLGPAMYELSPITLILSDSCLPWEEMDAVFGIESYFFFPETKTVFGLTSPSMFETRSDEEDCGFLLNALGLLLQFRQQAFDLMLVPQQDTMYDRDLHSRIPKQILQMKPWDLRRLMMEARMTLLPDVSIFFDRVFTPNEPHDQQILWRMAASMGAHCSVIYTDQTTHVITLPGSSKIPWARSRGCHVVSPTWIEASFVLWFRLSEECYGVKEQQSLKAASYAEHTMSNA